MHSIGMTRSDSTSSTATDSSHRSSQGASVRQASEEKVRTRTGAPAPHITHRPKSATGLSRMAKHSKSSDRIATGTRPAPRHNVLSGLAMTRAAPTGAPQGVTRKPVPQKDLTSALMPPPPPPLSAAKKAPVKFTMGGDESDSDDYEDEDDDDEANTKPSISNVQTTVRTVQPDAEEAVDDDEWASDSEDEEQERKARLAQEAERRKRDEEQRHKTMFQKQPIRSKSAADLKLIAPSHSKSIGPSPPEEPVRGLLSSLFHPDEQHPPPGQLAGRPHASAADLRSAQGAYSSRVPQSPNLPRRDKKHRDSGDSGAGPFSFRDGGGFAGLGGLKTSKSAVALPLLDTHAPKSSTAGKSKQVAATVSSKTTTSTHSDGSGSSPDTTAAANSGRPSSIALARLQALNNMKNHSQRGNDQRESRRNLSETDSQLDRHVRSLRLEVSPDDRDFDLQTRAQESSLADSHHRLSAPSLSTRHSDQVQQPPKDREELGSTSRSNSEGLPAGHVSPCRGSVSSPGPVSIIRPRSSTDLPEAAAPQTPRTTRRNMLRDELSESLRQNLLWERQSRSRMMGIGAPAAPVQQAPVQGYRRDNVLNGNMLRPLTSTGAPPSSQQKGEVKAKRYSEEWGSFHHKGW